MKKTIVIVIVCIVTANLVSAQKWSDLTQEQKVMKAKEFRADNQKYLKDSLGMTQTQMDDIDNVNICFLSTLDRIDRYGKDNATKQKYAKAIADARWAQLDVIMGADKHKQYANYVMAKIKKAAGTK
ncbi:MAG TPA: hypothetical protein VMH01_08830 [Puia sp.]|nr:hypothetical protein [Puia sp.]